MIINKTLQRKPYQRQIGRDDYICVTGVNDELVINTGNHTVHLSRRDVTRIIEQAAIHAMVG